MRSAPFHPDQLVPDSQVGPWRVVASLGAGGFGRVFKVERGGRYYSLKMALRPAGPHATEEEDVNGRLTHEVAALLACAPHPNLPRLHAVDRWPEPPDGYLYFVTDYVDGETFHEWRWRVKPTAAHLLAVFTEVVRVVADLHRRGVHHRDLKGDNLLIRREDERPFLIDLGTVRLPGATTLTVGVAPASPHLLPPECVAFLREGTWQQGAHFDAGVPGDLYALGALLYEALTDGYAFDPKLSYDTLLPAIELVTPRAPHLVNPKVPRALSEVAMRLLAKRPEDRYLGTEALLQALWDVAKEKRQPAWKVSLDRPPEAAAQGPGADTPRVRMLPERVREPLELMKPLEPVESAEVLAPEAIVIAPPVEAKAPEVVSPVSEVSGLVSPGAGGVEPPPAAPVPRRRGARRAVVVLGVGVLLFVAFGLPRLAPSTGDVAAPVPSSPSEKGSSAVTSRSPASPEESSKSSSTSSALSRAAAAATCIGLACASGPQERIAPPEKECSREAIEVMEELAFPGPTLLGTDERITLVPRSFDNIPAPPDGGHVVWYVEEQLEGRGRAIVEGSRFYGQVFHGKDRFFGWVTALETPDGKRYSLCGNIVADNERDVLGVPYAEGSTPERPMVNARMSLATTSRFGRLR
ncbi:serine/threonine protein kinase [Pyxidicoccus xibeiensis]|uniref:serine/threonine protein kinase n=1 Tax=Pyxidicoccus xibeiensis TaxID=2906759 RepID=UPI0020A805BF|nr:protein kinase [Pyxidicoccus xibeiensis]MCP3144695.1 serine/threonine protein kinase [Pyxidicoccus xibeiensis]